MSEQKEMSRIVRLFWSGGMDSTFVIVKYSRMPVIIEPYYLNHKSARRKSQAYELAAIEKITKILQSDPRTEAKILPLTIINQGDPRLKDREMILAHRRLYTRMLEEYKEKEGRLLPAYNAATQVVAVPLSVQDALMASVAKGVNLNLKEEESEAGVFYQGLLPIDAAYAYCSEHQPFIEGEDPVLGKYYHADCNAVKDKDIVQLFKYFRLPLVSEVRSKEDEVRLYKEWGYEDVMNATWSCHEPIDDKPCGCCTACIFWMRMGIGWRFSPEAEARYDEFVAKYNI